MDAVEDIKQRLSIEEVIGDYVELKRAGRNWKGLSPFSSERSPSFMVSPEKQIWHDFSSGKGGNMFSFVMEMEGLDFKGALELLARKAGVDLQQYRGSGSSRRGKEKERLYELLDAAATFYQRQLNAHHDALEYVRTKRKFSKETQLEWRLGYSPEDGKSLVSFLRSKKYTDSEIKASGLSSQRYSRASDMFRGRIMIPLADQHGRIIGFTARILRDDPRAPKYINTPQTILYDKSNHVFGLHLAKEAIRKNKYVVIAEGNLDVISSHQAGVRQVVATAGTALTEAQLRTLQRFTDDVRLCFDADKAGVNATERAIPIASKVGLKLNIITIPAGKDPDELIRADANIWKKIIDQPLYAIDWLVDQYEQRLDLTTATGKTEFSKVVVAVISQLENDVEKHHFKDIVAKKLKINLETVDMRLQSYQQPAIKKTELKKPKVTFEPENSAVRDYRKAQNHLLAIVLMQPKLRKFIEPLVSDMMYDETAKKLLVYLQTRSSSLERSPRDEELLPIVDYVKILALHYEELYQDIEPHELEFEIIHVRGKLISQYVKMQKQHIAHELQSADEETQLKLLHQVKELDNLLRTYKGGA